MQEEQFVHMYSPAINKMDCFKAIGFNTGFDSIFGKPQQMIKFESTTRPGITISIHVEQVPIHIDITKIDGYIPVVNDPEPNNTSTTSPEIIIDNVQLNSHPIDSIVSTQSSNRRTIMIEYLRWTHEAENLNYVGVLTKEDDNSVTILTKHGEFTLERTDGVFTEATREDFDASTAPVNEEPAVVITARPGTKTEQAIQIYAELKVTGASRKDIIAAFKEKLNMSDAGASTYYQNIKSKQG